MSWKGYAQDLGNRRREPVPDARPSTSAAAPATRRRRASPNPGSANATDQYVPKHFPFPWFESLLSSTL